MTCKPGTDEDGARMTGSATARRPDWLGHAPQVREWCRTGNQPLLSDFAASESFYTNALAALDVQAGYRTESIAEYRMPEHDTPSLSLESAQDVRT